MLKMYHSGAHGGGAPDLWEENWERNDFETALRFCESDPLRPLFERFCRPGTVMLEGGCGHGHYVAYYSAKQVRVVGLDFAQKTLGRLQARVPGLRLCAGDVARLPFKDGTFDVYYSGGVVEHFEGGPERAIAEAQRVLKPGGVLLISVPYLSMLRSVLSPFKSRLWKRVNQTSIESETEAEFFQYIYSTREFGALLAKAGFRVTSTQGYGILWGLYDVSFLEGLVNGMSGNHSSKECSPAKETVGTEQSQANLPPAEIVIAGDQASTPGLLKRLIVSEDETVPVAGFGVRLMRRVCANMMMYICNRL